MIKPRNLFIFIVLTMCFSVIPGGRGITLIIREEYQMSKTPEIFRI